MEREWTQKQLLLHKATMRHWKFSSTNRGLPTWRSAFYRKVWVSMGLRLLGKCGTCIRRRNIRSSCSSKKWKLADSPNPIWIPLQISRTQQKAHTCIPATTHKTTTQICPSSSPNFTTRLKRQTNVTTKSSQIGTKIKMTTLLIIPTVNEAWSTMLRSVWSLFMEMMIRMGSGLWRFFPRKIRGLFVGLSLLGWIMDLWWPCMGRLKINLSMGWEKREGRWHRGSVFRSDRWSNKPKIDLLFVNWLIIEWNTHQICSIHGS